MTAAHIRYDAVRPDSEWIVVVGATFVAVAAPGVADSTLDALWWLAESDLAEIESVVGAFPLSGSDAVSSFAVVSFSPVAADAEETTVTAVVRGEACVDVFSVGGARRLSAAGVEPWLLAGFRSVTGFALGGTDREPATSAGVSRAALPLQRGVARGSAVNWSLDSLDRSRDEPARPGVAPIRSEDGRDAAPEASGRVPEHTDPGRSRRPAGTEMPGDDTLILTRRPLPPLPVDRDDAASGTDGDPSISAYTLRIGVSESVLLDQPTIIGRNPRAPGLPFAPQARLITVASPELEVSGSHVQIQQVGEAVVVTDLRSTNGTFVLHDDRSPERLRPGESRVVAPGAALDIGDGNIIEIAHNPQVR